MALKAQNWPFLHVTLLQEKILLSNVLHKEVTVYEGGSICNENPCITPSVNPLGCYAICQTKDQSVALIMVYEKLFYLSKFNKLQTF